MELEGTSSSDTFRRRLYLGVLVVIIPMLSVIAYLRAESEPYAVPVYLALVVGFLGTLVGLLTRRLSLERAERLVILGVGAVVTARLIGVTYLDDLANSQLRPLVVESIGPMLVACVLLTFLAAELRRARNWAVGFCAAFVVILLPRVLVEWGTAPGFGVAMGRQAMILGLVTALAYGLASVKTQLTEERVRTRALDELANTDPLTRISNRRGGQQALEHHVAVVDRYGGELCVALFDLDNFKLRNDHHGHAAGDDALVEISRRLSEELRASDVFARWGGDELLIIAPGTDAQTAVAAAERWRQAVADLRLTAGPAQVVTASIGLAVFQPGDTTDTLLTRADHGLYTAKGRGGNTVGVDETAPVVVDARDPAGTDGEAAGSEVAGCDAAGAEAAGSKDARPEVAGSEDTGSESSESSGSDAGDRADDGDAPAVGSARRDDGEVRNIDLARDRSTKR